MESAAEFQEALSTAAQNHSDDTIKITTSVTDLGDFQLTPETGFSLKIIDGWNAGCTTRLNSKARPASTVLKNLPAEYFEPHCSTTGPKPPATAK